MRKLKQKQAEERAAKLKKEQEQELEDDVKVPQTRSQMASGLPSVLSRGGAFQVDEQLLKKASKDLHALNEFNELD